MNICSLSFSLSPHPLQPPSLSPSLHLSLSRFAKAEHWLDYFPPRARKDLESMGCKVGKLACWDFLAFQSWRRDSFSFWENIIQGIMRKLAENQPFGRELELEPVSVNTQGLSFISVCTSVSCGLFLFSGSAFLQDYFSDLSVFCLFTISSIYLRLIGVDRSSRPIATSTTTASSGGSSCDWRTVTHWRMAIGMSWNARLKAKSFKRDCISPWERVSGMSNEFNPKNGA